ncbi:MAG TPA: DUF420 domain-containing protein [Candidatus Binataceae bacterium]|nr:DUF420 domain-containing protein [Candidatus Binataceae bacterium]
MLAGVPYLATANATLNLVAAIFLGAGFYFIRQGRVTAHRRCMVLAFVVSVVFLVCYLLYHYQVGDVRFSGQGLIRPAYFILLISHILLAFAVPPLAIITLTRALRGNFKAHRRIARFTWPIWMYVSITGVIVYFLVYIAYGPPNIH